jgi:steroid 5-alpha reductase family enzyme
MFGLEYIILAYTFAFILLTNVAISSLVSVLSIIRKDNSVADVFYSLMFTIPILMAVYFSFYISGGDLKLGSHNILPLILPLMILIWGLRLMIRIFIKNYKKREDKRYALWRALWMSKGKLYFYIRSYLQIYLLQALMASIIVLPSVYFIIYANSAFAYNSNSILLSILGIIIFKIGFYFELFGDSQLDEFIKDTTRRETEKILMTGLWKYTRHPNYFGEAAIWWGIFLIATANIIGSINTSSLLIFAILLTSPLLINFLLRFVSGVPMTEKYWDNHSDMELRNKWNLYKKNTNPIWPKIF